MKNGLQSVIKDSTEANKTINMGVWYHTKPKALINHINHKLKNINYNKNAGDSQQKSFLRCDL